MATLVKPISFQNMVQPDESVPVQLVFFMALDQPKAQVEMLQEIAMVLQDAQVIEKLMKARNFADVKQILTAT
jgi:PTS system galactitol-specific IIA component